MKTQITEETIKLSGYSIGDSSVGIGQGKFNIDLGVCKLDKDDKLFIRNTIIKAIWELHDNGNIDYSFSDEEKDKTWACESYSFGYKDAKILKESETK